MSLGHSTYARWRHKISSQRQSEAWWGSEPGYYCRFVDFSFCRISIGHAPYVLYSSKSRFDFTTKSRFDVTRKSVRSSRTRAIALALVKPWPNGLGSRHKSTQVCKTRLLAYGLAKGGQTDSQVAKAVNSTHIEMTCDQLVSRCIGWPNGEKLASTCVRIWARPKSTQVNAGGWPNEIQAEHKSKTCADLWVRLASGFSLWTNLLVFIYSQLHSKSCDYPNKWNDSNCKALVYCARLEKFIENALHFSFCQLYYWDLCLPLTCYSKKKKSC